MWFYVAPLAGAVVGNFVGIIVAETVRFFRG